jgi:ketosteroid isomerase-like protein
MEADIEALVEEYTRRYVAGDVDGVTEMCLAPFLAIREGRPIHMAEKDAVHHHFGQVIAGYQAAGFASFAPVELDVHPMGESSAFVTVRWHAFDSAGTVVRDSRTTYHVLKTDDGWRFISYTNHF